MERRTRIGDKILIIMGVALLGTAIFFGSTTEKILFTPTGIFIILVGMFGGLGGKEIGIKVTEEKQ